MKKLPAILFLILCLLLGCGCEKRPDPVTREVTQAAISFGTLKWPDGELAEQLPKPVSDRGRVETETETDLVILVANTRKESFFDYAEACWSSGFSINYRRGDDYFYASKLGHYHLSIELQDGDVMLISLNRPKEPSEETEAPSEGELLTLQPEPGGDPADAGRTLPEERGEAESERALSAEQDYVVNTNTKKFHCPSCSSAKNIKDKNRLDFHGSREELIEEGYEPCKRCNP